jgi:hypothetical protein
VCGSSGLVNDHSPGSSTLTLRLRTGGSVFVNSNCLSSQSS